MMAVVAVDTVSIMVKALVLVAAVAVAWDRAAMAVGAAAEYVAAGVAMTAVVVD
jgi:hypothetical protein